MEILRKLFIKKNREKSNLNCQSVYSEYKFDRMKLISELVTSIVNTETLNLCKTKEIIIRKSHRNVLNLKKIARKIV